jgi:hypothetical protein
MYATYYDTSGTDQQEMVTTVGLFASVGRWERFEQEWKAALAKARMPYLHMKDFVHRNPPHYAHFKENEADRVEFLRSVIGMVADGDMRVVAMTVATEDFQAVNKTYGLVEAFGGPWGLCACMCATKADIDWRFIEPNALIAHFHERGERGRGRVIDILASVKIDLQFRDKVDPYTGEWFVPFQACDFIAWEIRKGMTNLRQGITRGRQSIGNLYDRLDPRLRTWKIASPENLIDMCERYAPFIEKR